MANSLAAGSHALCFINGEPCGKVSGFRWSSTTSKKPITGVDIMHPAEYAPSPIYLNGTISLYMKHGDGGAEGLGLSAPSDLTRGVVSKSPMLSMEKFFTLLILDRATESVIFSAQQCSSTSQSWEVPSRGLITGEVSFVGISWSNEST